MSSRVHCRSVARQHLAWESQPLVAPAPRPRRYGRRALILAFVAGVVLGLLF